MRRSVGVLLLFAVASFSAAAAATPDALFDLGMRAFRAGDYASAVVDLRAASEGFAITDRAASYETSLVYLALAQFRAGLEDEARDTILRLAAFDRVTPVYATLPLDADAADFEALVAALAPNAGLTRTPRLTEEAPVTALPPVRAVTPATEPEPEPVTTAPAVDATTEVRVEEIQRETDQRIATIQADADRRIAEIQADADRRIAAAQADADRRIAAAQAAANERVAAAEAAASERVAAAERANRERIAAAEAVSRERIAESERITPIPPIAPAPQPTPSRTATLTGSEALTTLRQASDFAASGEVTAAHELYVRVASDRNASREAVAESAIGLYRVNSFDESVAAFRRLGTFARGEEDLRYYFAVSLYETGAYREAHHELKCALPFIEVTDEVARYRLKIEQSAAVSIARNL